VSDGVTGILFDEQTPESLLEGLERLEGTRIIASAGRASALRFTGARFLREFSALVDKILVCEKAEPPAPWFSRKAEPPAEPELAEKAPLH
jgi:hypothetical protein